MDTFVCCIAMQNEQFSSPKCFSQARQQINLHALDDYFDTIDQVQFDFHDFIFGYKIQYALPIHSCGVGMSTP